MSRPRQGRGAPPKGGGAQSPARPAPGGQATLSFRSTSGVGDGTVEGEVIRITYENPETGFRVVRLKVEGRDDPVALVGVVPPAPAGTSVRATGKWERNPKHGDQFRAETLIAVAPQTLDGIVRFLGSGLIKGVGQAYAQRIVDAFGLQTLEVLDRTPERLSEVAGLGAKRADSIRKAWTAHRAVGAIMIFLQSHGASPSLAARVYKRFGPRAIEIVSRSPYRLALDVWGIGFKTADRIAMSVGVSKDAPERAQAGLMQVLHDVTSRGHVFLPRATAIEQTAAMLEVGEDLVGAAIDSLAAEDRVVVESRADTSADEDAIYPRELFDAERRVAERLHTLLEAVGDPTSARKLAEGAEAAMKAFEDLTKLTLAPAQRDALRLAAQHKVLVLTGGPGVGKTTIVRAALSLLAKAGLNVRLAAPTGRAAKRMTETTGVEATTIHRLLEFEPRQRTFLRNDDRPLVLDALILDEASMVDLTIADALLSALPTHARLIVVGDVDQLPSVGPGAVLADLLNSNVVPVARLNQIFRQAEGSLIVQNAHRIHDGEPPESAQGTDGEFYVIERRGAEEAAELIHELVTRRIPQRFGLRPARDIQVLTPMHHGEAGAIALNERLQKTLNPNGPSVTRGQRTLRVGDKVMQLRNDYDREVFNGDVGFIKSVDPESRELIVEVDGRDVVYEESDLDELTLSYATSIHKSQGSEYPAVVLPVLTSHFVMLSRNLLYTGVTRGKKLVVLVADRRAMSLALGETRKEDRNTRLAERIRRARSHL